MIQSYREIQSSRTLRRYGTALLAANALTGVHWLAKYSATAWLGSKMAVCWPFLQSCNDFGLTDSTLHLASLVLAVGSLVALPAFLLFENVGIGLGALAVSSLLRAGIVVSDYAFMGNYHYLNFIALFVFLFVPKKTQTLGLLIVLFYFSSSFLKFNYEWLSGHALLHPLPIGEPWATLGLYYAVILEAVISWLLISRFKALRWFAMIQFLIFHVISISSIGFYFPLIMILIGSLIFLDEPRSHFSNFTRPSILCGLLFLSLQLGPYVFNKDLALSGLLRIGRVNMLDAQTECTSSLLIQGQHSTHLTDAIRKKNARTACDPLEALQTVKWICARDEAPRLDFVLDSRRSSDIFFTRVLSLHDACHVPYNLTYAELFAPAASDQ